jgi:hypothetical protein
MTLFQAKAAIRERLLKCSICSRDVMSSATSNGRCHACYEYRRRTGRERTDARPTPEDRFWRLTQPEPNSGCVLWLGATASSGYGKAGYRKRTASAHRIAYEMRHGPVPEKLVVRHRCDTKLCVNPDHLVAGTHADNMADMDARGRRPLTTKLTQADLEEIRSMRASGAVLAAIAAKFGITTSYACVITTGKQIPRVAA